MSFKKIGLATLAIMSSLGVATQASGSMINITVSQDVTVYPGGNNANNIWYDWVGGNYSSIFGFDMNSLAGFQINAITFSAYHNYWGGDDTIGAAIGLANGWDRNTVTGSYPLGPVLDSELATNANLNSYQTWDLGNPSFSGNYLTVGLVDAALNSGWNDYEPLAFNGGHAAFITVDYSTVQPEPASVAQVSEPASLALLGLGLAGIGWSRRKARQA